MASAISAIANSLQSSCLFGGDEEGNCPPGLLGMIVAIVFVPLVAMLLQLGVPHQREYLTKATGARMLGWAPPLANALESLEIRRPCGDYPDVQPAPAPGLPASGMATTGRSAHH